MNTIIGTIGTHKEKWLENFARFGIASKGVVYCLLGLLAFLGAVGAGQKNPDKKDVFGFIVEQPFGKVLLAIVGLGLLGYAIWRFIQSFKDPEHTGNDKKGVIKRIGYGVSALIYTGLSFYAISLVLNRRTGGGDTKQHIVDKLLDMNGGAWIVGIVGLIIIIRGLVQIYNAYTGKFKDHIHHDGELFDKAGKIGYTARGIVLAIIGFFFIQAAVKSNAGAVDGTDGAFGFIGETMGSVVLALIALGLLAYGAFMFFMAKYRTIEV